MVSDRELALLSVYYAKQDVAKVIDNVYASKPELATKTIGKDLLAKGLFEKIISDTDTGINLGTSYTLNVNVVSESVNYNLNTDELSSIGRLFFSIDNLLKQDYNTVPTNRSLGASAGYFFRRNNKGFLSPMLNNYLVLKKLSNLDKRRVNSYNFLDKIMTIYNSINDQVAALLPIVNPAVVNDLSRQIEKLKERYGILEETLSTTELEKNEFMANNVDLMHKLKGGKK